MLLKVAGGGLTCLCDGHDIIAFQHRWNGIHLNRGWLVVARKPDVLHHDRMQAGVLELMATLDVRSCRGVRWAYLIDLHAYWSLDRSLEIEALSMVSAAHLKLSAEELVLEFRDGWANLAVLFFPLEFSSSTMPVRAVPCEESSVRSSGSDVGVRISYLRFS